MKIILSPAKKMYKETDSLNAIGRPVFVEDAKVILNLLKTKDRNELQKIWKCNDKLTDENIERIASMDLSNSLTPAILSYEGIAYKYMSPAVFDSEQLAYIQKHLRILSAFYGVVKPMDGVVPYRLEMQAKLIIDGKKDLYEFWGSRIYNEVRDESGIFINLASKEYYKCIDKYLTKDDRFITCDFVEDVDGKMVTKGTYAKMARGEMVRFMAERKIEDVENIKEFNGLGYVFRENLSNNNKFVFEREIR
ncbi:MAG: peroxide stress protein YaaA [Catonella sp.]|uniref:peroxide stress protein YaaA n=1 Tax=Catonella sp. TaxID=2382125 RepID=UPI003FA0EF1C